MAKKIIKKSAKKVVKKTVKKAVPAKASRASAPKKSVKKVAKKATKKVAPKKASKKNTPKKVVKKVAKKIPIKAEAKVTSISPYLNFEGNCEEAFDLYKSVFGGNFATVARFNEMPPMEGQPPMPEAVGKLLMHVSLPISKETVLMGSDIIEGFGPPTIIGNNFAVSVSAKSQSEADRIFNGLSAGANVGMPMEKTFWGSYFGMLTDKFGINWQVSFDK